ncbi:glycoside hydrolase superfamily [Aspergillus alliaceus]|uniref:Glycoside hydrolase superfamily n=1 Tax=Petromyces alliaceus TaxID=209559 RepID=A0A5N7CHX3_PETAA|nr:glycoside hydrolase superfamily [Aspergillus alliaceus]
MTLIHLRISCFHLCTNDYLNLNKDPPHSPKYYETWSSVAKLQALGLEVMAMLDGGNPGSFPVHDNDETLRNVMGTLSRMLRLYKFYGIDLNVKEPISQKGINRLIERPRKDFPPSFEICMTPANYVDFQELEQKQSKNISFYNGQFYNGFGCIEPTNCYDKIDMAGFRPKRVVAGVLANPANAKHHNIGGIMVWEYFNAGQEGETHTCELYEWQCIWA